MSTVTFLLYIQLSIGISPITIITHVIIELGVCWLEGENAKHVSNESFCIDSRLLGFLCFGS